MASKIKKLLDEIDFSKIPALDLTLHKTLPYKCGPIDAKIAFIGEAPGREEENHELKHPFVGESGKLLRAMLMKKGINPDECYFSNILKERPEDNLFEKFVEEKPKGYINYVRLLASELAILKNCHVFVPVGAEALKVLCGKEGIENYRGSIIPAKLATIKDRKCVPIIHPAAILRQWLYKPATFSVDIPRILEESVSAEINLPKRNHIIRPKFDFVLDYLEYLEKSTGLLSIDTESDPKRKGGIISIQFAIKPEESITIPFTYPKTAENFYPIEQEIIIWRRLARLLHNCGKRIIGQNFCTFDTFLLSIHGLDPLRILRNIHIDIMEAAQCLQPQLPADLGFLTSVYTREPYYKSEIKGDQDSFWRYGGKDACIPLEIAPQLETELRSENLWELYNTRYLDTAVDRMKMSIGGMRIDLEKRKALSKEFIWETMIEQCKLNILVGEKINVKSNKQMKRLLYDIMKLPVQYKKGKKGRSITTDEDAITVLSEKAPSPIFGYVLKIRNRRTLFSGNIEAKLDSDNRFRTSYTYAETGRFRSGQCPLGTGGNAQNWNKDMRVMIIPDQDEELLVEADQAQAEVRVVIYFAGEEKLIKAFETPGVDFHKNTATEMFRCAVDQVTFEMRYLGKRTVHASDYDMMGPRFAQIFNKEAAELGFSMINGKQGQEFIEKYHAAAPKIRSVYHKYIQEQLCRTKTLYNPFGRRMIFHDRIGRDLFKQGYAFYAQSTVGDLTNIIMQKLRKYTPQAIDRRYLNTNNCLFRIINQIHDALLFTTKRKNVDKTIEIVNEVSKIPLNLNGRTLTIPIDFKVGSDWKSMKEVKLVIAA